MKRKVINIIEEMVMGQGNSMPTRNSPAVIDLPENTVSVSITNMSNSANFLIIGWNENPSTKNFLAAGESIPYGPWLNVPFKRKTSIRLAFANVAGGAINAGLNQARVSIAFETEEDC